SDSMTTSPTSKKKPRGPSRSSRQGRNDLETWLLQLSLPCRAGTWHARNARANRDERHDARMEEGGLHRQWAVYAMTVARRQEVACNRCLSRIEGVVNRGYQRRCEHSYPKRNSP